MKTKDKKNKRSMIELLREIRDKISLETQDMSFEELQEYLRVRKEKYAAQNATSMAAEPRVKYGKP